MTTLTPPTTLELTLSSPVSHIYSSNAGFKKLVRFDATLSDSTESNLGYFLPARTTKTIGVSFSETDPAEEFGWISCTVFRDQLTDGHLSFDLAYLIAFSVERSIVDFVDGYALRRQRLELRVDAFDDQRPRTGLGWIPRSDTTHANRVRVKLTHLSYWPAEPSQQA